MIKIHLKAYQNTSKAPARVQRGSRDGVMGVHGQNINKDELEYPALQAHFSFDALDFIKQT